jgi:hypothetical protein
MTRFSIGLFIAMLVQIPASDRSAIVLLAAIVGNNRTAFNELASLQNVDPCWSSSDRDFQQPSDLRRDVNRRKSFLSNPMRTICPVRCIARRRSGSPLLRRPNDHPESIWPAYIEQQTDYSGCTVFGSGRLVEGIGHGRNFKPLPESIVRAVRKELDRISSELTDSTCACEDVRPSSPNYNVLFRCFPVHQSEKKSRNASTR